MNPREEFILRVRTFSSSELALQLEASTKAAESNPSGSGADEVTILNAELSRRFDRGETPVQFIHDCLGCTFIGTTSLGSGKTFDFYKHSHTGHVNYTEYVWRYGNEGDEYYCMTHND